MTLEATGDANNNPFDTDPDGFVNDPLGRGNDDTEVAGSLGDFFLRNRDALEGDLLTINPIFSLHFDGPGASTVSAEIWDIDGNQSQGTEKWKLSAFDINGDQLGLDILSPEGTTTADATSLNGEPWRFTFDGIGDIARVDVSFVGTKREGIGVAFDNLEVAAVPLPATVLLLMGGIGGLAYARRRQARA